MLIVIIAWMYVVILMALTEHSFIAGLMTLLLYGLLPLGTVVYLLNTPARRARRKRAEQEAERQALPTQDLSAGGDEGAAGEDRPQDAAAPGGVEAEDAEAAGKMASAGAVDTGYLVSTAENAASSADAVQKSDKFG